MSFSESSGELRRARCPGELSQSPTHSSFLACLLDLVRSLVHARAHSLTHPLASASERSLAAALAG
eukprot:11213038-Alexandrium_andersonii.AAC.1